MNNRLLQIADIVVSGIIAIILILFMLKPDEKPHGTIYPQSLKAGDKIAILAPAGPVDSALVDSAARVLRSIGFEPVVYPTSYGKHGYFSGTHDERLADLKAAFSNPDIRAILCARGGYGAAILLDSLAALPLENDPKWVIGFSDISALHALLASRGIASIHSSMAKQLALGPDDPDNKALLEILQGNFPTYTFSPSPYNHLGHAQGKLLGGNLAVIQALISTPYDIIHPGTILFIEDVSEPIYKIERFIYQLRMSGIISNLNGMIIGQFTEYEPDSIHNSMEQMIAKALADYPNLPVAFDVPVGHVDHNVPFIESAMASLDITPSEVTLRFERENPLGRKED